MATRRMRAFKRWMRSQGIDSSDALELVDDEEEGISVRSLCDLHEDDLVATIPKLSCLTVKTSGARDLLQAGGLEGALALSVAIMYEKWLGQDSPWFAYLQLLSERECVPLLWTPSEIDSLLSGTELHKIVEEDKALVYKEWKECIHPLLASAPLKVDLDFFGTEQYFAAKSLVSSRSFQIDNYHGFGMVPLADLFNHKTGAENVHFTSVSGDLESENDAEDTDLNEEDENSGDGKSLAQSFLSGNGSLSGNNLESSSTLEDDPTVLEMIIVKGVKAGDEVFNTYGTLGNAALLDRYGFTEPENPYDIVNIDLELVIQWSSALFSNRRIRTRLSLWRKLDYSGCISQNSEYFEISYEGEPQVELLILLYIMLLPEETYGQLDLILSTTGNLSKPMNIILSIKGESPMEEAPEISENLLLTEDMCDALLALANIRENLYGSNSVEDDVLALKRCCFIRERKLYHSLMLRVSERRILGKFRMFAQSAKAASIRNKLRV